MHKSITQRAGKGKASTGHRQGRRRSSAALMPEEFYRPLNVNADTLGLPRGGLA